MAIVVKVLKLQLPGGKAVPGQQLGTTLGPTGVNMQEFCTKFNEATKDRMGEVVPTVVTIYDDRKYTFITKIAPVPDMLKKAANIQKGSGKPLQEKIGSISRAKVREIAEKKLPDLNTKDVEKAMKIVEGTARQMGLIVTD